MQTRHLISILLSVFVLCSAVLYHQNQQFDYIYLDGYYYGLTQEKLETRGVSRGKAVGTIQRNTDISSNQHSGDSNLLPVGATIYSIDCSALGYQEQLHYDYALTYFLDGEYRLARLYLHQGEEFPSKAPHSIRNSEK